MAARTLEKNSITAAAAAGMQLTLQKAVSGKETPCY